ncbi:hypothetical protein DSCA_14270 [Desulfosarcina alkanivorans]|uniref:Type IV pilus modification protein PilV n=1 Tax=Desulfosarcina alkanivorans TaxID=571177 RepID=A0A5K7YS75_9BACT|nr:prepilin-type N-terminal cleavage/methylation domain-containing protein [Desulfosarcina alkanivorans]BBO67497.1 hypothetical protein DSCA_14270 [Desulfosarcina alkanivorans]
MAPTHFSKKDSGFTLIEVLIAIAIFSIGLLAVGALQARSLMATGDVARKTEAWTIADEQVALLKAMPFYADDPPVNHPADLVAGTHTAVDLSGRYTVHWRVWDDDPINQQNATVLAGVPAGTYTVCKRITLAVTPLGGNPPDDTIAEVQFIKTWAATGIQ